MKVFVLTVKHSSDVVGVYLSQKAAEAAYDEKYGGTGTVMSIEETELHGPVTEPNVTMCNVCGKPATSSALDILQGPSLDGMHLNAQPIGRPHYGCDQHPARSTTHRTDRTIP